MKIDLETLAQMVEERIPVTKATCLPEQNQILIRFANRPDVEVALLTPYFTRKLTNGSLDFCDLDNLLIDLKKIARF